jgi:hypothetical protein
LAAWLAVSATVTLCAADARAVRRDADSMKQKIDAINKFGLRPSKQGRRTTLTESELNAYLALELAPAMPAGVVEPSVAIVGPGRLAARAVVDLDAVRRARPGGSMLDPRALLMGQLPITASGVLRATNGVGRIEFESAAIGGVPIPKVFLQEILSYYSKTPERPNGVSLDDPFELPAHIREIQVDRGQAIVVQ